MKVLYFFREEGVYQDYSNLSNSRGSFVSGIYIPSKDIALCREAHGGSPGSGPVLTDNEDLLNELRFLKDGHVPDKDGVNYSSIKEADVDEDKIRKLIEDAKKIKELAPTYNSLVSNLMSGYLELVKEINI